MNRRSSTAMSLVVGVAEEGEDEDTRALKRVPSAQPRLRAWIGAGRRHNNLATTSISANDLVLREVVGRTVASFIVTDPKYQKSGEHPPDKMDGWEELFPGDHVKHSAVALFNNAHLKEMRDMLRVLQQSLAGRPLRPWQVRSVRAWYRSHYLWTSRRFQVNRSYIIPLWEERFHYPHIIRELQNGFERDLHDIAVIVDSLAEGDLVDEVGGLLGAWIKYDLHLEMAMDVFTNMGMMLYHAYFSYDEHVALMQGVEVLTKLSQHTHSIGATIDACGGFEPFHSVCGKGEGAPFAMEGFFRARHAEYVEKVASYMRALELGDPGKLRDHCAGDGRRSMLRLSDAVVPFNPLDLKYKKDEQFAPNKLDEWTKLSPSHVEDSDWVLANSAHRAEVGEMKEVLESIAARGHAPEWAVDAIKKWWACHRAWTTSRLDVLRTYTIPVFERRFLFPTSFRDALDGIRTRLRDVGGLVEKLRPGDDVWHLYDLLDKWSGYESETVKALDLTEPMATMLFHAYFTKDEADRIVRAEHQRMSNLCAGSIIHHAGKGRAANALTMNALQVQFRLTEYNSASAIHLQALQSGREKPVRGRRRPLASFCSMLHDIQAGLKEEEVFHSVEATK